MSENAKLVQDKDFDSHTNLIEVINDNSEYAADTVVKKTEILHNVTNAPSYKIGQQVVVDFDGDDFLKWDGEITGIFETELLVYLY